MRTLQVIAVIVMVCILVYGVWSFYQRYRTATGTVMERIWATAYESGTILWSRFVALVGIMLGTLAQMADFLGAPGISAVISKYLDPQVVGLLMVFVAIVTEVIRRRNSSIDPITK